MRWSHSHPTGNKLNVDRARETMVLSFTFLELGQEAMSSGMAWLTPVCLRSNVINDVEGGWANCFRLYLRRQLLELPGLSSSGVAITVHGEQVLLHAKLFAVLSDGDGHQKAWDWKGASSLKPCLKHYNVYKKAEPLPLDERCFAIIS